jgi:hypothetical protein
MRRQELTEISQMVLLDHLDIRAVTMGINLLPCAGGSTAETANKVKAHILQRAQRLIAEADKVENVFGIPIKNKRIAVTPIGLLAASCADQHYERLAIALDEAVKELNASARHPEKGIAFVGGYSSLVDKGYTRTDPGFIDSIPAALAQTSHVCSSLNVASTRAGINMDAVLQVAGVVKKLGATTEKGHGCAKFVVFANAPNDNPFMAGAFHGVGEPECVINVGISGPSVIKRVVENSRDVDFATLADRIKRAIFKIVRAGTLVGKNLAAQLGVEFGIVDLSLAPTPDPADNSIARIIEAMGIEVCGAHGTTAALALLVDAVKKGGVAATSSTGGLSGAFIPVSEDMGMVQAVLRGALTLDKLEALTSICSVGMDMVGIPGETPVTTIAALIADELAIGVINNKTTAVRLLPIPGAQPGDVVDLRPYNDLLGSVVIMAVKPFSSAAFFGRSSLGRVPAPLRSLTN